MYIFLNIYNLWAFSAVLFITIDLMCYQISIFIYKLKISDQISVFKIKIIINK